MKDFINWTSLAPYLKSVKELKAENQSLKDINENISNYYIKQSNDLCDVIKELREENEKLKEETRYYNKKYYDEMVKQYEELLKELKDKIDQFPDCAEDYFQFAKYYFGFDWKYRIFQEYFKIFNPQKEKESMEEKLKIELGFKDVWEDFRRVNSHLRTHTAQIEQILEKLEKNESSSVYDDDSHNDNHNDRYSELLTRVQCFYEYIKRMYIFEVPTKQMEEIFADFIYISED